MQKLLNYLRDTSLLCAMMFFLCTGVSAQSASELCVAAKSCDDPIAAMLDSLLNQHYIEKLNNTSGNSPQNNFHPLEVPAYSDEVYRDRIKKIQTPIPLTYNAQVKEYIDLYAVRKRGLTERVMGLSAIYFPLFEQMLDQQDLPLEFKYLSIVESALNPTAVSRMGATGIWQFMLNTGKLYNLKINSYVDERRDPYKSTYAACQYFKDMYNIYHDWLLVIAAYNCGAGNVNKAIARSGGKTTFWEISSYLPRETRGYVPAFIAVTYLFNHSSEHNLTAVAPIATYFEFDTVMVDHKISLREIAEGINTPVELLSYLNPMYKKGIIPQGNEPFVLKLPANKVNVYLANSENIFRPAIEREKTAMLTDGSMDDMSFINKIVKKHYKVKRGEKLSTIADRFNCSTTDIRKWNKLKSSKVQTGQKLVLYVNTKQKIELKAAMPNTDKDSALASNESAPNNDTAATTDSKQSDEMQDSSKAAESKANPSTKKTTSAGSEAKFVYHIVQPGDTLWNIARRYQGVTVEKIKSVNQLSTNQLKPGTRLKVVIGG